MYILYMYRVSALRKKHIKKKVPSARAGGSKSTFDPGFRFQKKSRKGSKWLSATIVTLKKRSLIG